MNPRKIKDDIFWCGAVDWDRRLFDSLIPLPHGTSYNAYLIKGSEKTVLIDSVDPEMKQVLLDSLEGVEKIDYIVSHHAEQDHSGAIPDVIEKYPGAQVICTPKAKDMLMNFLFIPEERIRTVEDKETLSLGNKTLEFIHAPWVHWPETMVSYLREDKVLFSCDFLGSHVATTDLFVTDERLVYRAAKRYYAEIMMPFRTIIEKNLKKLEAYEINLIATSHGPCYDKPEFILDAYRDWVSNDPKNIVVLPYVSMHGSTQKMVDYFVNALVERNVTVKKFNLAVTDIGELAMALVDAATIVVATPTVMGGAHPLAVYATYLANALRPKTKFISIIGSYGWGGKMVEQLAGMISNIKAEVIEPVLAKGLPNDATFKSLDDLAEAIAGKHSENELK